MKWYRYWAAAFAVMLVQSAMTLCAATFYVDGPNGSDARSWQYVSAPKKTIQAAIKVASPGDIIRVAPGTYAPFEMTKRLTIIGTMEADRTIIDGGGTAWTPNVTIKGGTSGFYSIGVKK